MGLESLVDEELLEINLDNIRQQMLYVTYITTEKNKRISKLYELRNATLFDDFPVETLFLTENIPLDGEEQFWQDWIEFLEYEAGDVAAQLLKEAILYKFGIERLILEAERHFLLHPSLFLVVLEELMKATDFQRAATVGQKALELIEPNIQLRSKIALITAQANFHLSNMKEMQVAQKEVYRSYSTPENYLRLYLNADFPKEYRQVEENFTVVKNMYEYRLVGNKELEKNVLSSDSANNLRFLHGEFDYILSISHNPPKSLGWSSNYIYQGVHQFLLHLYSGNELGKATKSLASETASMYEFNHNKIYHYFDENKKPQSVDGSFAFERAFMNWKVEHPLSQEQKNHLLNWLEVTIEQRAKAIVGGGFRKHYAGVALLVIALGEVKESLGMEHAKKETHEKYKKMFPRHRAFLAEMKEFL
ncbi:MAG: hypothetical protein LBV67_11420 [Streptococcaceae bacterium]|nr:hypothetical protein [Streptococcaceae bacterium]